ncbi:histidine kinase [Patiriisocius marinus]|uniref:histidine kinase n=1 Tax=Patiriisocius marinus TaxID=1397112 RepID=A0A5J4J0E7_9FLAO|nr:response regulator [Patiriisocius marinus]GER59510.1 histidine kinase [Patiriisocius marinus]
MEKKLLLILLIFCYSLSSVSQDTTNSALDSVNILISLSRDKNINGNYEDGLKFATQAVQNANKNKDKTQQAKAYVSLANTYQVINDRDNARKYYNIALDKSTDDYFVNVASLNGLGNIYSTDKSTVDKAARYFEKSIVYTLKAGKNEHSFYTYYNIAGMYLNFEEPDKAYPYILKADKLLPKIENENPLHRLLQNLNLAIYYNQKKDHKLALTYINKALEIGEEYTLIRELIDIYDFKSEIHQELGAYEMALASLKKMYYYKDLDFNAEKNLQVEEVAADFKVNEFKEKAEASKLKTNIITLLSIGILLFLSTSFLIFYNYKRRLSYQKLEIKNQALLQAKNEAEYANKVKSDLLVNISHDLRTPLYGILGITGMLIENPSIINTQKGLLNSLKYSGDHLKSVVNNILKINEVESDKITLKVTNVNLRSLLENIVKSLNYLADQQETQLILDISEEILEHYIIDDANLSEVIINLIDNAIKHTKNGTVTISASMVNKLGTKHRIEFKVSDTGSGISKENLSIIFDNFKQGDTEENTLDGIGLGLPIVKSLLMVMGSKLSVTSDVGVGSQFSFILECEVANKDNKSNTNSANKSLQILVVEDNKINQLVTKKLISSLNHNAIVATNGKEALKAYTSNNIDVILMDLNMPIMNGFEAAKVIAAQNKNIPIIALTSLEISEVREQCLNVGILDIINKPIDKEALKEVIQKNVKMFE